jgi:diguanylate cyclase (GGDEF)-like protein
MRGAESSAGAVTSDPRAAHAAADAWVVRAQDGDALAVLREVDAVLRLSPPPQERAQALYAKALCRVAFDDLPGAVKVCGELVTHCRNHGLAAAGLRALAVLVDLLRRIGRMEDAIEHLAAATALEPRLTDLSSPDVQVALGSLALALRHCGVAEEADRIEHRLAVVEAELPLSQRVSRLSNHAFEHAVEAMELARRPPFLIDERLLHQAVAEIDQARELTRQGSYRVVLIEADVLTAFAEAAAGDPEAGLCALRRHADVLTLGSEAMSAKVFWIAGLVRALCRQGRHEEAVRAGTAAAARIGILGMGSDTLPAALVESLAEPVPERPLVAAEPLRESAGRPVSSPLLNPVAEVLDPELPVVDVPEVDLPDEALVDDGPVEWVPEWALAWAQPSERLMLSYELMRAEHPMAEEQGSATAGYLWLAEQRVETDQALLAALFRARVALVRGADERRVLAQAASVDSLTGLVNRRGAAIAVADAARRPSPDLLALLLIDLDGFKEVNDSQGHLVGDGVLREVAGELRTAARLDDVVARWGGDEFVVIAVLDADRAVALADRLRERVRECAHRIGCPQITASVGVAVRDRAIDEQVWLRRADEAMYAAKRSGGDATVTG